ncbi:transmembrane protein 94-like protein l(2)k05819 isoform X3 [Arctopsyche grandis]|uniref:transmembrane protein 94-like protein l(2)k05819 isoform X3 n=1 Tax=Arctopsyche grandis TaxID=121162 RepID=UPI00406D9CF1
MVFCGAGVRGSRGPPEGCGGGLGSRPALLQLREDVAALLIKYPEPRLTWSWITKSLSPFNENAIIIWPTFIIANICVLLLYVTFGVSTSKLVNFCLPLEATAIWIFIFVNAYFVYNESKLTANEIHRRINHSLVTLDQAIGECDWEEKNYPHLCAPFSPCVTLQWTYRDGKVVNLPWALLVKNDIIVMRPGQESPGKCQAIDDPQLIMFPQQIYQPSTVGKSENFTTPRAMQPHKSKLFKLLETPYISNVKLALDLSLNRPVTVHNKQRYLIITKCIELIILPIIIVLILLAGFMRHFYLSEYLGTAHWTTIYILQTVTAIFPLLPTMFPIAWIALNTYGTAKFKYLLENSEKYVLKKRSLAPEETNNLLLQISNDANFVLNDEKTIWKIFFNVLIGKEDFVCRSANIVQVLGSVTALCCVDKKGILSWPNPTAEKVFFLRNSDNTSNSSSKTSFVESSSDPSNGNLYENYFETTNKQSSCLNTVPCLNQTTVAEVLDLTHDQNVPFGLEFDDNSWKKYIACLKPLGLAILLNTCNLNTQEHYSYFCAHLTCEATQSEDVVPVTNRRCLCELAKQIGFIEEAKNIYTLQNQLAIFRHLPPDVIRRDTRFARSLHLSTRVKVPLPHMLGVIIKDQAGGLQLMSQGTADMVLDSCIEFWNGQDLCILSPSDRKKILDFYQRSSLTAYCSAFAYRPLTRGVSPPLASMFMELPADCPSLYPPSTSWNESHGQLNNQYHSTDSLLFSEVKDDDVNDVDGCFELQCNQVFIGMVTMQYQAQIDMVELIEKLDCACIRFVHFSKENELRSRVFSEKMGLESGWNCHISLSSENNSSLESSKPLSISAPGAINLDHATVKFDNETSHVRYDARNYSIISQNKQDSELRTGESQDSVLLQGWETGEASPPDGCRSLSCLTDSTDHSAPVNFDMRNRAKLPRGIDNIRPHIEQVDNVPLLVSLFTDCTANTARRMISIMQDYNEVVCVMGSAANKDNMEIFMQADASIAVEPIYPVLCQKIPPYQLPRKGIGPIDLARILNSVPCSISIINQMKGAQGDLSRKKMPRETDISLFSLVTMSRYYMMSMWSSIQFWLSASFSLVLLQLLSLMLCLPMILTLGNVMWFCMIVIPVISVALMCTPVDSGVMKRATYKHQNNINLNVSVFVLWCYGSKFIPGILVVILSYGAMLRTFCNQIVESNNALTCVTVYPSPILDLGGNGSYLGNLNETDLYSETEWRGWSDVYEDGHIIAQQISFFVLFLFIAIISVCFVHREHSLWEKNVCSNKTWLISVFILLCVHCAYFCTIFLTTKNEGKVGVPSFDVPLSCTIVLIVSHPFILVINEFVKWQEIKVNLRYQRRARLDFGTKLGMNSPF